MTRSNRDRINLVPKDSSRLARWRWANAVEDIGRRSPQWQPVALIHLGGTLVRNRQTGVLAEHLCNRIVSVNQRKADAAIAAMEAEVSVGTDQ